MAKGATVKTQQKNMLIVKGKITGGKQSNKVVFSATNPESIALKDYTSKVSRDTLVKNSDSGSSKRHGSFNSNMEGVMPGNFT